MDKESKLQGSGVKKDCKRRRLSRRQHKHQSTKSSTRNEKIPRAKTKIQMDNDRGKKSEEECEDKRRTLENYTRIVMGGGWAVSQERFMCQTDPAKNNMIERQVKIKAFLHVTEQKSLFTQTFTTFHKRTVKA